MDNEDEGYTLDVFSDEEGSKEQGNEDTLVPGAIQSRYKGKASKRGTENEKVPKS